MIEYKKLSIKYLNVINNLWGKLENLKIRSYQQNSCKIIIMINNNWWLIIVIKNRYTNMKNRVNIINNKHILMIYVNIAELNKLIE